MKKVLLVMVSALVMAVFIGFNYLLWDRENKIRQFEAAGINKNTTIETLSKEIRRLDEKNKTSENKIKVLELEADRLKNKSQSLEQDKTALEKEISLKNVQIDILKQTASLESGEQPVRKWVDFINKGKYNDAFVLMSAEMRNKTGLTGFNTVYKNNIKNIKLKSIELYKGNFKGSSGKIIFTALLSVKKNTGASGSLSEGDNTRYFSLVYDPVLKGWVINGISVLP